MSSKFMKYGARTAAVGMVLALIGVFSVPASLAQSTSEPDRAQAQDSEQGAVASLELISQTSWVVPNGSFDLSARVASQQNLDSLDFVVTVFGPVRSRSAFTASMNNQISGSAVIVDRQSAAAAVDATGVARISLPVSDRTQRNTYLANSGVYPVRVELRDTASDDEVAQFVTHLVKVTPSESTIRLNVATIVPVTAQSSSDPEDLFATPSQGAEFSTVASALNDFTDVDFSPVVSPESVERLYDSGNPAALQSLDDVSAALARQPILPATWTPVPASLYTQAPGEGVQQVTRGRSTVVAHIGEVTPATWPALDLVSQAAVQTMVDNGTERVVVREANLTTRTRSTTLARPFKLQVGSNTVPALQADSALSAHFTNEGSSVLRAHQLLADLAVLYNDYPGQNRGVVAMAPSNWSMDESFLRTYLAGLQSAPVLQSGTTADLFAVPPEGGTTNTLNRALATLSTEDNPSLDTARLATQRRNLNGFDSMVNEGNTTLDQLQQRLLASQSLRYEANQRQLVANAFDRSFRAQIDAVRLPDERAIRFTARQGEIPVSIQNDTGYPVTVKVRLTGDQLIYSGGRERTVSVERQQVTDRFAVETRTSGSFPVQIQMTSPDGNIELFNSRVVVRSTVTSGVGLGLTIGSVAFLVLWWLHSIYKNRRSGGRNRAAL